VTKFTYTVTVEVEDDLGMPIECYNEDLFDWTDDDYDEDGNITARWLSPDTMASIVMANRLGCDEDYGFDYTVDWSRADG
jgi:hypothetical protein